MVPWYLIHSLSNPLTHQKHPNSPNRLTHQMDKLTHPIQTSSRQRMSLWSRIRWRTVLPSTSPHESRTCKTIAKAARAPRVSSPDQGSSHLETTSSTGIRWSRWRTRPSSANRSTSYASQLSSISRLNGDEMYRKIWRHFLSSKTMYIG